MKGAAQSRVELHDRCGISGHALCCNIPIHTSKPSFMRGLEGLVSLRALSRRGPSGRDSSRQTR